MYNLFKRKTEIIDKLKEQTTYTITFDSKGGSEVKSITAEAGAKLKLLIIQQKRITFLLVGMKVMMVERL